MPIRLLVRDFCLIPPPSLAAFNGNRVVLGIFRRCCAVTSRAPCRIFPPREASIAPATGSLRFGSPLCCTAYAGLAVSACAAGIAPRRRMCANRYPCGDSLRRTHPGRLKGVFHRAAERVSSEAVQGFPPAWPAGSVMTLRPGLFESSMPEGCPHPLLLEEMNPSQPP